MCVHGLQHIVEEIVAREKQCRADRQWLAWHPFPEPWKTEFIPTLTGQCHIVMRVVDKGMNTMVRTLDGFELMALQGWHLSWWKEGGEYKHDLLTSLAGNAFSAFALGVMAAAALSSLGNCPRCQQSVVSNDDLKDVGTDLSDQE